MLEWRCGNVELAESLFRKGLKAQPRNKFILQAWACMEARGGNSANASRIFGRAYAQNALDGASWQARALQHQAEGRLAQARRCFAEGVSKFPQHLPLYHAWAKLESDNANAHEAREILQRAVWIQPDHPETVGLWCSWALLEERAGEIERARDFMRTAMKADRFSVPARVTWAALEARNGNAGEARQLYEDALRLDPANGAVWADYENMERALGRAAAAELIYGRGEEAAALASKYPLRSTSASLPSKALNEAATLALERIKTIESSACAVREEYGRVAPRAQETA